MKTIASEVRIPMMSSRRSRAIRKLCEVTGSPLCASKAARKLPSFCFCDPVRMPASKNERTSKTPWINSFSTFPDSVNGYLTKTRVMIRIRI